MEKWIPIGIAFCAALVSVLGFWFGRQSAARSDEKEQGEISSDLKYIRESVNRIDKSLTDNVKRLEGRIDEQSSLAISISQIAGRADEKAASAHKRLDEHLKRDHKLVVDTDRRNNYEN